MALGAGDAGLSGCETASTNNIPASMLLDDTKISGLDGEICYCNTDLCVAQQCDWGFVILSAWLVGG